MEMGKAERAAGAAGWALAALGWEAVASAVGWGWAAEGKAAGWGWAGWAAA